MPSTEFEPATPATKRPQTYALDRAATEVGSILTMETKTVSETLDYNFILNMAYHLRWLYWIQLVKA
jgi:hypothetical protein